MIRRRCRVHLWGNSRVGKQEDDNTGEGNIVVFLHNLQLIPCSDSQILEDKDESPVVSVVIRSLCANHP